MKKYYQKALIISIILTLASAFSMVYAQANEPTQGSSNLTFSSVSTTSIKLQWTNGNGARRIVVARAGSAVNANPGDGTDYIEDWHFGGGSSIGTGNFVVYDGTGNNFNLFGLAQNTTYYFKIFEYNGTGSNINYNVTSANVLAGNRVTGSTNTLEVAPVEASSINVTPLFFNTQMRIKWTNGNGTGRIVVVTKKLTSQTPITAPPDGANYPVNATFGNGHPFDTKTYAIYQSTGNNGGQDSTTIFGLSPTSEFIVGVFEFNGEGNSRNYTASNASPQATFFTVSNPPTTASTGITFHNVTPTGMTLKWTKGNGEKRVIARSTSTLTTWNPTDGQRLQAGDDLGNGISIQAVTDLDTCLVENLAPNTIYNYKIVEYNGDGNGSEGQFINYQTASTSRTRTTLQVEPTVAASNITFSNVTASGVRIRCNKGNGSSRLILVKQGSAFNATPIDGSANYVANTVYGNGANVNGAYVVYNGTDTTVTVTGLNSQTKYNFVVIEYNGIQSGSSLTNINYLTQVVARDSVITQQINVNEPSQGGTNMTFSNITENSITIGWTNGDGDGRMLVAKMGNSQGFIAPADGTTYTANANFGDGSLIGTSNFVVYQGTGSTVTITGLGDNNMYSFALYEYNQSSSNASMINYISTPLINTEITTPSEPTQVAANMLFENLTADAAKVHWENGSGTGRLLIVKADSPVDETPSDNIAYTANQKIGDGEELGSGNFVVYHGSDTMATLTGLSNGGSNTTYYFALFEYNQNHINADRINYNATPLTGTLSIVAAPDQNASNMTFSDVTTNSMTVNWTSGNGTGRILIAKANAFVTVKPSYGTIYQANANFGVGDNLGNNSFVVYNGTESSVNITNLLDNDRYYFALFEYNQDGANPSLINYASTALIGDQKTETVGIFEQASNNIALDVFPNPNHGSFTITANQAIKTVEIVDVLGKVVFRHEPKTSDKSIQIEKGNWSEKGIYFLKVATDNGVAAKRFIIE